MRAWSLSVAIVVGILLSVGPPTPPSVHAATITVNTSADELTTNGQCSLREALRNANAAAQPSPDCAAGSGNDTINLPAVTITLAIPGRDEDAGLTGDLDILRTVAIQGQSAATSRVLGGANAGVALDRVFDVQQDAGLTLRAVGVGFGSAGADPNAAPGGGGIQGRRDSVLVLEDVEVFENFAVVGGGIFTSSGTVALNRTTVAGNIASANGGGITANIGTVTLTSSTIRNNDAGAGGGLSSAGSTSTITNSTITTNRARNGGGGVIVDERNGTPSTLHITGSTVNGNVLDSSGGGVTFGLGAGLRINESTATVVNSTISGNRMLNASPGNGGGIRAFNSSVQIVHTTVTANQVPGGGGGGLSLNAAANVTVRGTIVAGNTDSASGTADNCDGTVDVSESNLTNSPAGTDDCGFTTATDLRGADPRLASLQDNGGPTQTHALQRGSDAIDHIQSFLLAGRGRLCTTFASAGLQTFVDQRGAQRGVNGTLLGGTRCDVGAFEREGIGTGVTELSPTSTNPNVNETVTYSFPWEVPSPKNWHDLARLELRFRDAQGTALHLRWNEAGDTFQLVNQDGTLGPAFPGGSAQTLQTPYAGLNLANVRTQGSGPTGPLVTLTLPVTFTDRALGRTLTIEALAVEDSGTRQGFDPVGTVTIGSISAVSYDPNNDKGDKSDKDQAPRLTEEQRQQRERTNRSGLDDYRTEGNAIASRCGASPPEVDIANRDGTVTLVLLGDTASQCASVDPGEYLQADGVKLHEQRYEVDSLTIRIR